MLALPGTARGTARTQGRTSVTYGFLRLVAMISVQAVVTVA